MHEQLIHAVVVHQIIQQYFYQLSLIYSNAVIQLQPFFHLILGLLPIQKGKIYVDGIDYNGKQSMLKISYVSQKAQAFKSGFPASVKEVVLSGLTKRKKLFQRFNNCNTVATFFSSSLLKR